MSGQEDQLREWAKKWRESGGDLHQPLDKEKFLRKIEEGRYGPNVPETRVNVTDFDAIAIGNLLAMLADRHTDSEILSMLKPKKVRAALGVVRAAQQQKEGKQ